MVSPGEILELLKDSKGFLWLLSRTKVQRYDGKRFLSFSFDERCLGLAEDDEGVIWMASQQRLYRFKNDYEGFEKVQLSMDDSISVSAISSGPGKKVYLLAKNKILFWDAIAKKFDSLPTPIFPGTNSAFPILKAVGNSLYYQKNDSILARYNVRTKIQDEVKVKRGNFLFPINEDTVWVRQSIGSSVLVSFLEKKAMPIQKSQFDETFDDQHFFVTGSNSDFSFISLNDKGYYSFDPLKNKFTKIKLLLNGMSLPGSPPINCFYKETNGNIWFANEMGLVHFNPGVPTIGLLRSNTSFGENWNNSVRSITEDENGNIWFATANGFCRLDKLDGTVKTWTPKFESESYLNYSSVRAIGYSNGKIVLVQSEKGCWIFDPLTGLFLRPQGDTDSSKKEFEKGFNSNMIQLKNGNFLVLSRKVWLMNKDNFIVQRVKFNGFEPFAKTVYQDSRGRIWFVGSNGIFCCDSTFQLIYKYSNKEFNRWANAIVEISDNTFWVASKKVLEVTPGENGDLLVRPVLGELKDAHLSSLFKDSLQNVWMFSDNGIYRYIPESGVLEKFEQENNAQQYYTIVSNTFQTREGVVYAGSLNGINYFDPEKIALQSDSLSVQIMNVSVNQDDTTFMISGRLPPLKYFENSFLFEFTAPYITAGGKVSYRCRLLGSDKDWIYLGNNNSVRYTSLAPGKYSLKTAATLNGKDWFEMAKSFQFTINPPFWQTWWFKTLLFFSVSGLAVYFFRRRITSIKLKAAYKQQLTELEVKALRAQMNPHFIFNALNSIQQFTLMNDVDNANLYISKFSSLLRKVLLSSRNQFISLEEEKEQLTLYLEIEKLRFGKDFTYSIQVDNEFELDAVKIPGMLIQPFVENALKHGLALKEGEKNLAIIFSHTIDNEVLISITDNGVGRRKAIEVKEQQDRLLPHQSMGLELVEQRLRLLGYDNITHSATTYSDLRDEMGRATGTRVTIRLPI